MAVVKRHCSRWLLLALAVSTAAAQEPKPAANPAPSTNASAQENKPAATLAELRRRLAEFVAEPRFAAALWGVQIVSLDTGNSLFAANPQKLFSPASNSKLYTIALGLDRLGPDYRIKTSLYSKAKPGASGALDGDLIAFGRGDPTFNAQLHGGEIYTALEPLVSALTNAGVKRVTGDLVGDESFFRGPPYGAGWVWDDLESYYGAEISALTINDNTLSVTVTPGQRVGAPCAVALTPATSWVTFSNRTQTAAKGAARRINFYRPLGENVIYVSGQVPLEDSAYTDDVTVHNPAGLFVSFFREALARHGIEVGGKVRSANWLDREADHFDPAQSVELGAVESPPLSEIAKEIAKPSQNLYTDMLLAHVGEKFRADDDVRDDSESLGVRELNRFLAQAGVKRGDVIFEEGSGLSRDNLTTPNATVALLRYVNRQKYAQVYFDALPIAGVDGTLRNRMKGTPAAGNLRGKTGTLRWANSLSGYVTTAAGEHLAFSLMLNRYRAMNTGRPARAELDYIGALLAGFTGRSGE